MPREAQQGYKPGPHSQQEALSRYSEAVVISSAPIKSECNIGFLVKGSLQANKPLFFKITACIFKSPKDYLKEKFRIKCFFLYSCRHVRMPQVIAQNVFKQSSIMQCGQSSSFGTLRVIASSFHADLHSRWSKRIKSLFQLAAFRCVLKKTHWKHSQCSPMRNLESEEHHTQVLCKFF